MEINVASDKLSIAEPVPVDESIESDEYREYEPQNPAALNNGQAIQIDIQNQDVFRQPSRSFLLVEGQLASTDAAYAAASLVSLINNAIPFMFSQIRYLINNTEIENVMSPGQTTTMKECSPTATTSANQRVSTCAGKKIPRRLLLRPTSVGKPAAR